MLIEEPKSFTSDELYEFRKVLVDWKWRGPDAIHYVLSQLCKGTLEKNALIQSKLYKSVYILRNSIKKAPITDLVLYNKDQVTNILLKLKTIHNQIKEIVTKPTKKENKKTVFSVSKYTDTLNITTSNIQYGDYLTNEQRKLIQTKLTDNIINLTKSKSQQELFLNDDIIQKSQQLSEQLESTIYNKYLNTVAPSKNYNSDLKTLYQYLGKDKTGIILHKLFQGYFTIQQASQLQVKDWLDEEYLREIENRNIQQIQNDDADYYRQIRIKEMTQSKGQECPRCHNNYLYIIDMKQIRRADEPTTIFYECFACQHKYKV